MPDPNAARIPREDIIPPAGRRMVVRCDQPGCDHAALLDPRPLFGAARSWPSAGRSYRFRCRCGSRAAMVSYTSNTSQSEGPISPDVLALWF